MSQQAQCKPRSENIPDNSAVTDAKAYIITGPTSGFGQLTAFELARLGTVILVGRDPQKLAGMRAAIEARGQKSITVLCDLSDLQSVRRAAAEVIALKLPIAALINNAGVMDMHAEKTGQGLDKSFATNHLGPFAFTEALLPHLADGANVVFVASGVEDPERKPAVMAGFRGGRYISAEACARGEWKPGGSKMAGADAYATSKQASLATALAFARENPHLRINAVEPGFAPATNLGRDAHILLQWLSKYVLNLLAPYIKYWSTPAHAAKIITGATVNIEGVTGVYFDERGKPMQASNQVRDPSFQDRVVQETRALLAKQSG